MPQFLAFFIAVSACFVTYRAGQHHPPHIIAIDAAEGDDWRADGIRK